MLDTGVLASTSVCTLAGDVHSLPPPFGNADQLKHGNNFETHPFKLSWR